MHEITRRQKEILDYLVAAVSGRGNMPSHREIARRFGLRSPATVHQHLQALERKGYLSKSDGDYVLDPRLRTEKGIPLVGNVAAGTPILAIEHVEARLTFTELFGAPDPLFVVRVEGDSMSGAGILAGDLVIVKSDASPSTGDIVVAYLGEDQEATVKYYREERGRVSLEPANPHYDRIVIESRDRYFRLGGRVVGVVRNLS